MADGKHEEGAGVGSEDTVSAVAGAPGLQVRVLATSAALGAAAAAHVAGVVREAVASRGSARVIFATGASQFDFIKALVALPSVPWDKVHAFHLDEYCDLPESHPASFRKYLRERLFSKLTPSCASVHLIDPARPLEEYAKLLQEDVIDLACIGVGENGHLAFNDPPVADFDDPVAVKIVKLDDKCIAQQIGEGWFATVSEAPTHAVTLTIPAIMRAKVISCVVPDTRKAPAIKAALTGEVCTACPASVLRKHPNSVLWLDAGSASLWQSPEKSPEKSVPSETMRFPFPLVDLQVNGIAGIDFSSPSLTTELFQEACEKILEGVTMFCPTIITSAMSTYEHVLPLIADCMSQPKFRRRLLGIHLEGPFLSPEPGAIGCHPRHLTQAPSLDTLQHLLELGRGQVKLITLAAELEGAAALAQHARQAGVVVSLGHQLADNAAIARLASAGATALTHLGNGCPSQMHRHCNPIWAGLAEDRLSAMFIPDGLHIPFHVLRVMLRAKTLQRSIFVSDLAPAALLPPGVHECFGTHVQVCTDQSIRQVGADNLAGAGVPLPQAVRRALDAGVVTVAQARLLAFENPLRLLGLEPVEYGDML